MEFRFACKFVDFSKKIKSFYNVTPSGIFFGLNRWEIECVNGHSFMLKCCFSILMCKILFCILSEIFGVCKVSWKNLFLRVGVWFFWTKYYRSTPSHNFVCWILSRRRRPFSFTNFFLSKTCKNQINKLFFCKTLSCVFKKFLVLGSKQDIPNLFFRVEFRFACKNVGFLEENYDKIYVCFCRGTCVNAYRLLLKSQINILRGVSIQFLLKFPNF